MLSHLSDITCIVYQADTSPIDLLTKPTIMNALKCRAVCANPANNAHAQFRSGVSLQESSFREIHTPSLPVEYVISFSGRKFAPEVRC